MNCKKGVFALIIFIIFSGNTQAITLDETADGAARLMKAFGNDTTKFDNYFAEMTDDTAKTLAKKTDSFAAKLEAILGKTQTEAKLAKIAETREFKTIINDIYKVGESPNTALKINNETFNGITTIQKGKLDTGNIHIDGRHVTGTIKGNGTTSFFPVGIEVRPGVITPNAMTKAQVDDLILESTKYGRITNETLTYFEIGYNLNKYGISEMITRISKLPENYGSIFTSYPTKGANVISVID